MQYLCHQTTSTVKEICCRLNYATSSSYQVLMIVTSVRIITCGGSCLLSVFKVSGTQFMGRSAASPSGGNFDNTRSPLQYSNSPQSTGMVNAPSPQQQQQRSKLMQLPQHQQQLLAQQQQQQLRQSSMQGLGQVFCYHTLVTTGISSLALLLFVISNLKLIHLHLLLIEPDVITSRFAWARAAEVSDGKFLF